VVESTGLENQQGFIALLEFKSLSHRQIKKNPLIERLAGFLHSGTENINVFLLSGIYVFWFALKDHHQIHLVRIAEATSN
jgi:hypothetical protein